MGAKHHKPSQHYNARFSFLTAIILSLRETPFWKHFMKHIFLRVLCLAPFDTFDLVFNHTLDILCHNQMWIVNLFEYCTVSCRNFCF